MPDYKGRIFGRSVLDVRFRAYYGEDLFLGELLVGCDPERGRRYLFRVTDVAYGSESSDEGWAERTAGGLLAAHGRYAMLLFDPHGEYLEGGAGRRGLIHHPWAAERLRVYSPSPRAGQANLLRLSLAELSVDDLRTAWKFTGPQSEALESAAALLGDKGMWLKRLAEEEPEELKEAELGRHALATIQVLSRRAKRIVQLPLMTSDPSQSLTGKVLDDLAGGKVVLVDTSGLEAVEGPLVPPLLTRTLLNER